MLTEAQPRSIWQGKYSSQYFRGREIGVLSQEEKLSVRNRLSARKVLNESLVSVSSERSLASAVLVQVVHGCHRRKGFHIFFSTCIRPLADSPGG